MVAKQFGRDALHAFKRVGNRPWLLENFFLHVVAVGAQVGGTAVGVHGFHLAADGLVLAVLHRVDAQLNVHHIAFFQIHNFVGDPGQGHGIAGQKGFALTHTQDERRARASTHHPVRFVFVKHRQRIRAMQLQHRGLEGLEHVALVEAVHQMGNHLGVGLAAEHIALGLQRGAQLVVVFNDAVVHQGHAAWLAGVTFAMAEMRVRVVHRRCAMRGPAGVGDPGATFHMIGLDLCHQLRHPRRAAGALQTACSAIQAGGMHRHTARVVAPVLQALQTLHKNGDDVAAGYRGDDATHVLFLIFCF